MKQITVLPADDNSAVRREFKRILELEDDLKVVGEAQNGLEAVVIISMMQPALDRTTNHPQDCSITRPKR